MDWQWEWSTAEALLEELGGAHAAVLVYDIIRGPW
jgi:hypothetical protein